MTAVAVQEGVLSAYASCSYKRAQARTSAPSDLIVALHDAALGCLGQVSSAAEPSAALIRAHALIAELRLALDPVPGAGEGQLSTLYDSMLQCITRAFAQRETSALAEVQSALRSLRIGFAALQGA